MEILCIVDTYHL